MIASALLRFGAIREQKYLAKGWESYAEYLQHKLLIFRNSFCSARHNQELKQEIDELRSIRLYNSLLPHSQLPTGGKITFKHSGNAGDLIYALPTMKALSNGLPAQIFLRLNEPINGWSEKEHPLGKSGLTEGMVQLLRPLLESQSWISSVQPHANEKVDYDMDTFRKIPLIRAGQGHIAHWYFWLFPVSADISKPWLKLPPLEPKSSRIILARSVRYLNRNLDYRVLNRFGEIDFVGTRSEFTEMQKVVPKLHFRECSNFLEMASMIQSSRFFVGNQSLPFALAEALKVRRILEISPKCPDVVPCGNQAGMAMFHPVFEELIQRFWDETA